MLSTSGVSRNNGRISVAKLSAILEPSGALVVRALTAKEAAASLFQLESKDRGKLRSNVVCGEARDSAKQRQRARAIVGTRTIIALFVSKRHPLVPLVLNISGEQIAASPPGAKAPGIARRRLIIAIVNVSGPSGVASFWIGVENARQWKA